MKKLSEKQKKIAKVAGDPNKIEGEDFKKLKEMKKAKVGGLMGGAKKALQNARQNLIRSCHGYIRNYKF